MATEFKTVPDMLLHRVSSTPSRESYSYPDGSGWKHLTWKDFGDQVKDVAMGLRALGLQNEQRVGLVCSTRYEWIVADMGINCAGAATTTVYPSSTEEDGVYILNDSNSVIVIAENADQVKKLLNRKAELKSVKQVVVIDGPGGHDGWVMSWADLVAKGKASTWAEFETVARSAKGTDLATLIYTSGTTGKPKGVELIHDCWVYEAEALDELSLNIDDVQYLWLPLAHSFGKLLEVVQIRVGFATAVDGRVDKIIENLGVVKPTFVAAVPRIFEKVYNKVVGGAKEGGGLKYSIFKWAIGVGKEVSKLKQARQPVTGMLAMKNSLADKLVFSKLKARFGGRVRYFISGSAPLSREIAEFFHACDILILEGYGLTESSAFSFVNRPDNFEFGSVGQPAPRTELKIDPDSGEILIKGRGIMRGYHGLGEATAESLKAGWLHTGDKGELTALGNLKITDRIKDLIKTSGGKYVAPQTIEGKLKSSCPYVSQVLVHGNNRNFCTALVALDPVEITNWARANQIAGNYAEIVKDPKVHAMIKPYFDELNKVLANYESIKRFAILPQDLTLEAGDLTPSLKLKRKAVEGKYKDLLDGFYAGGIAEV